MTKDKTQKIRLSNPFLEVLLMVGLVWLNSSYGKVIGGEFVGGMAKTLGFFASKNPNMVVKNWLETVAIPQATFFGTLTLVGELLVAVSITGSIIFMLVTQKVTKLSLLALMAGLFGGILMNFIFWLAAGWTSPSTNSLNLLMLGVQGIGFLTAAKKLNELVQ